MQNCGLREPDLNGCVLCLQSLRPLYEMVLRVLSHIIEIPQVGQLQSPLAVEKFPLTNTTSTAAYAAVAAKMSCRRALVRGPRLPAKPTVNKLSIASCGPRESTYERPRIAPSRKAIAASVLITDTIVATLW